MPVTQEQIATLVARVAALEGLSTKRDVLIDRVLIFLGPQSLTYTGLLVSEVHANGAEVAALLEGIGGQAPLGYAWDQEDEVDQDAGGRFDVDPLTGEITLADDTLIVYANATTHPVRVRVTDANGKSTVVTLDIEVASPISSLLEAGGSILENAANGSIITRHTVEGGVPPFTAQFVADEADAGGRVSADAGPGDTIDILKAGVLDFSSATSHDYKLEVTDSLGQVAAFVKTFQVLEVDVEPPLGEYSPVWVRLSNTYWSRGQNIVGATNGSQFWMIFTFRRRQLGTQMVLSGVTEAGQTVLDVRYTSDNILQVFARNAAGTQVLVLKSTVAITNTDNSLTYSIAGDLNTAGNNHLRIDHVDRLNLDTRVPSETIPFESAADWRFGAFSSGFGALDADAADIGFAMAAPPDFSNATVQGRIKTADGRLVDPGADGSTWSGTAPHAFWGGPSATVAAFNTSLGSDAAEWPLDNGEPIAAPAPPPGTDTPEDPDPEDPPTGEYEPDVVLEPGDNLVSIINANPAGTHYGIKKGLYSPGTLASYSGNFCRLPLKSGDVARGVDTEVSPGIWSLADPDDVVFVGAVKLPSWQSASSGGIDYWDHPSLPAKLSFSSNTSSGIVEAREREDLFVIAQGADLLTADPLVWRRTRLTSQDRLAVALTDSETGFRGWRRNTNTARIRQGRDFNPSNHDAYLGVIGDFQPRSGVSNTTLSNLTYKMFASDTANGAITLGGSGHTLENVKGRLCHAGGIRVAADETVNDCEFTYCGQFGMNFNSGRRLRCRRSRLSFGRNLDYTRSWDCANAKGGGSPGSPILFDILFELCLFEGGRGTGLWFDGNHTGVVRKCVAYYTASQGFFGEFITSASDHVPTPPLQFEDCLAWLSPLNTEGATGASSRGSPGFLMHRVKRSRVVRCQVFSTTQKGGITLGTGTTGIGSNGTVEDMQAIDCDIWHVAAPAGLEGWTGYDIPSGLPSSLLTDALITGCTMHVASGATTKHAVRASGSSNRIEETWAQAIAASATPQGQFDNTNSVETHTNFEADKLAAFQAAYDALKEEGLPQIAEPKEGLVA
jgi:hypothetical protein